MRLLFQFAITTCIPYLDISYEYPMDDVFNAKAVNDLPFFALKQILTEVDPSTNSFQYALPD